MGRSESCRSASGDLLRLRTGVVRLARMVKGWIPDLARGGGVPCSYSCEWCGEPGAWPRGCSPTSGRTPRRCAEMIDFQCALGDHRRCSRSACAVAARWHDRVRAAGVRAAGAADAQWAVVAISHGDVVVLGTDDDRGRTTSRFRACTARRPGPIGHAPIVGSGYLVRRADGELF